MRRILFLGLMLLASQPPVAVASEKSPGCFELRTYYAAEGKLDALNTRFRNHTTALFTRHGMTNVGYWMPVENPQRKLVYLLSYPDLAAREDSWKAFGADPEWVAAKKESEISGRLVDKVESRFLKLVDFSPPMIVDKDGAPHTFEMRTYTATPGNLPRLLKRFQDHTVALFGKHGMRHFGCFTPLNGQPGADSTLIYFLVHASPEGQAASFTAFRTDPQWIIAKSDSEASAGGSLTVPEGVESQLLKATDYSPVR